MATTSFETIKAHGLRSLAFPPRAGSFAAPSRLFTWALRLICLIALGITGYLAVTALRSEDVAGCSGAYWDCSHVLHSRWSKVLTVPISIPGFALYAVVLAALAVCGRSAPRARLLWAWGIVTVAAIAAGLVAFWFVGLQVFAIGHLCPYCLAAHACGLVLLLAILWKAPLGGRMTAKLSGISILGASTLVAAQVFAAPPPTYKVEHYPKPAVNQASAPAPTKSVPDAKQVQKSSAPEVFEAPPGN